LGFARFFVAVLSFTLTACGFIQDRSTDYVEEEQGKPLHIPEHLSDSKVHARYPIPEISNKKALPKTYKLPEPPDATAALNNDPYVIESVEGQTWLRLYTSPGKVWPLLDLFWSEHGLSAQYENISKGYMQTDALTGIVEHQSLIKKLESTQQHSSVTAGLSFKAKLTQGVRRNTAELQVRAIARGHESKDVETWPSEPVDQALETALLKLIGEFVSSDELENRYSLLANDIGGESRVRLLKDIAGEGYLELRLSFQRAWNEIGKALKSAGVVVADYDRSQRVYFVSYLNEEELHSWYDLGLTDEEKSKEHNLSLLLEADEKGNIQVRVKLLNPELDPEKRSELLNIVFEHIS